MQLDLDQYEERAAIAEFDAGMTRFEAETFAARQQGAERWQAVKAAKEAAHADGNGSVEGYGHHAPALDGRRDANDLPGMQRQSQEENRPMPEREPEAGRDRGALLALRMVGGQEVQR